MSKWFNRQKVSIRKLPAAGPSGSESHGQFEQLFRLAFSGFRVFALTPGRLASAKDGWEVRNTRWMRLLVCALVTLAWIALVESFFVERRTAQITGIANYIQLITNTIALTVAWVGPQLKAAELQAIFEGFLVIDRELAGYRLPDEQLPPARANSFSVHYALVLLGLALLVAYDGFVSLGTSGSVELWYWAVTQVPFVVQAVAFFQAFLFIGWLLGRFQHLNALVEQYYRQGSGLGASRQVQTAFATPIKLPGECDVVLGPDGCSGSRRQLADDLQILTIVSRTIDLAQRLESYFGPLFLTVYTALFAVTTIQSYYCYLHLHAIDAQRGLSLESLVLSGAVILANVVTIVALPYACERVEHESKLLMSFLSKLSMSPSARMAQHSSIWFSNLIASVRFSALGFFTINYNMLSGLVAGLVTYLIIFIQFNSMVPGGKTDLHYTRSKQTIDEELGLLEKKRW